MTHPRMVIREATAVLLRNDAWVSSAVSNRIYCSRVAPLNNETEFPSINVRTVDERTTQKVSEDTFEQELDVHIDIFARRVPDMVNRYKQVEGLDNRPRQTQDVDQFLDDVCEKIEILLFGSLFRYQIQYLTDDGTRCLLVNDITELNTDFEFSADGQVPYGRATIRFTLKYNRRFDADLDSCIFDNFTIDFRHRTCTEDPKDDATAIGSAVYNFNED